MLSLLQFILSTATAKEVLDAVCDSFSNAKRYYGQNPYE